MRVLGKHLYQLILEVGTHPGKHRRAVSTHAVESVTEARCSSVPWIEAEHQHHRAGFGDYIVDLLCGGQSIGTRAQLVRELRALSTSPIIAAKSYMGSIDYFAGADGWTYASAPMKGPR